MSDLPTRLATRFRGLERPRTLAAIVIGALAIDLVLMWYVGDRAYPDVYRAVEHGARLSQGAETPILNSKTVVGPVLWHRLYETGGLGLLRATNVALLLGFLLAAYRLGRTRFGPGATAFGLFLIAYYPGTHRNVVAGEQDDMVAGLSVVLAAWAWLASRDGGDARSRSWAAALAGLSMGLGLLFKYWVGTFAAGLLLVLLLEKRWRDAGLFAACAAVPFALLNFVDGLESYRSLVFSFQKQAGYTGWGEVGSKLFTTGLALFLAGATIGWFRDRDPDRLVFLLVPLPYVAYVFLVRDAWAMTFVMMVAVSFWGMLVANELLEGVRIRRHASAVLAALALLYLLGTTAIAYRNLFTDTTTADQYELGASGTETWRSLRDQSVQHLDEVIDENEARPVEAAHVS
ncbi:MAG: glycosyltransferase family 39 protein [Gemmatimonadota bacterium]